MCLYGSHLGVNCSLNVVEIRTCNRKTLPNPHSTQRKHEGGIIVLLGQFLDLKALPTDGSTITLRILNDVASFDDLANSLSHGEPFAESANESSFASSCRNISPSPSSMRSPRIVGSSYPGFRVELERGGVTD